MIITIRTSYAGVDNPKKDIRKSEKIAKKFGAKAVSCSDKSVDLEVQDVYGFERAHREAKIDYLIQKR